MSPAFMPLLQNNHISLSLKISDLICNQVNWIYGSLYNYKTTPKPSRWVFFLKKINICSFLYAVFHRENLY